MAVEFWRHGFLTVALDGSEWATPRHIAIIPAERAPQHENSKQISWFFHVRPGRHVDPVTRAPQNKEKFIFFQVINERE